MTWTSLSPSSAEKSSPISSSPRTSPSDPTAISSSPRTPSPLNPNSQFRPRSPSPTPPRSSTTSPAPSRTRLHSLTQPDPSLLGDGLIPVSRVTSAPAAPQSSTALSPPVLSSRSRSPSGTPPEPSYALDKEQPSTPTSSWWDHQLHSPRPWFENSKRKRTLPPEQVEGYVHTRSRVVEAVAGVLGVAASISHEVLFAGVDLLRFSPIPGLELLGHTLLSIWDAVDVVEMNRLASLRLTERCADILVSVREEIIDAGYTVAEELNAPISKLNDAFQGVLHFLTKMGRRPFLKRYLRRDEIAFTISSCDAALNDALGTFGLSIQIRTLKLIQANELRRQNETQGLLETLSHLSDLPSLPPTLPPPAYSSPPMDSQSVQRALHALRSAQNEQDRAHDTEDLRQIMRAALAANDDADMFEVLQIARSEMPEAIKTLQRTLERVVEDNSLEAEESPTDSPLLLRSEALQSTDLGGDTESRRNADTLDREFIESGIDALRRLSTGTDLGLPSWTITRYEVDLVAKIGFGFFSEVYRGTWRAHTVAIKVLAEMTPRNIFVHEVEIWKKLYHPNVLELLGASSASGEPPWFLVSKYYSRGSLVKYLKGLTDAEAARVDSLRMIHEISKGMAYLHREGVLHGDLKAANILVDDDTRCIISDFGQSEMKSEVYRISHAPPPRGTLRWQAPELMQGAQALTAEMDVYAFAICCVEILTKGALPWPLTDDNAVRHFVLTQNMRPILPPSPLTNSPLMNVIRTSWDAIPSNRPSFEQIARDIKKQRTERSMQGLSTSPTSSPVPSSILAQWSAQNQGPPHHSPDILPQPLPDDSPSVKPGNSINFTHSSHVAESGHTGGLGLDIGNDGTKPDPPVKEPLRSSSISTSTNTMTSEEGSLYQSILSSGYLGDLDRNNISAKHCDERRYRMLLQHDYHTILTLPLWKPSHVELGAVGFLSKPEGRFETLFNAFNPGATSNGKADELPTLLGYGKVYQGSQRQDKRNAAQRSFDRVQGLFSSSQTINRTHSFQLRAGHKVAYIYTETTMYRYITNLDVPKKWFQSNIDHIMKIYSGEQRLTREDIFLVIGALDAPDYASFVSHNHQDGQVNFNVFAPARVGRPWGQFTLTCAEESMEPSSGTVQREMMGAVTASNVSLVKGASESWDSVLLARLRFKPDIAEPTSL